MGSRSHAVLFMTDTHVPHHDPAALEVFCRTAEEIKPRDLIITGDLADAGIFARWEPKSFAEASAQDFLEDEIKPIRKILTRLRRSCRRIIYILGNHEFRIQAACVRLGRLGRGIHSLLDIKTHLDDLVDIWVDYGTDFKNAHYKITPTFLALHGLSTSKHAAAKHLEKLKSFSVVYGHTHRAQSDTRRNPITDDVYIAQSGGCLSKLQPLWMHGNPNEWVHGFSLAYVRNDLSRFSLYSLQIEHGKVTLPSGKVIKG